ncbi:MAG: hypothetical protein ACOY4U_05815 [Pseudomonadota bacterium]
MMERDWWDFGFALQDAFPEARYYRDPDPVNRKDDNVSTPEPPELPMARHLLDTQVGPSSRVKMVFDPAWQPQFKKSTHVFYGMAPDGWRWSFPAPPAPCAMFRLGGGIYDEPVPHPSTGDITFYIEKNKAYQALAGRFFRLLSKFTTNKKNLVRVKVPSMEVTVPVGGKGDFATGWCGHHAIEWARQEPNRVLFYVSAGFGIRPTAEVKPFAAPKAKAKAARKKA